MALWSKKDDDTSLTQPIPAGWKIVDLGLLGQGGMSRVYRVRDESLGREIALKVLRPELAKHEAALERFVEEAKITAKLDHPNIPPVYALAAERKTTCFTMKVLEGLSLQQLLEKKGSGGVEALFPALEVLLRVCDAVAFAHSRGIIHCDLKPQNVMVGDHGQIYVVDWGLARHQNDLPSKESDDGRTIGTPAYMAPEQARGQNYAIDERTDVFALGGMLYRILAGRPPYVDVSSDGTLALAKQARIASPETFAPPGSTTPRRLITIALRALSEDPDQRYPSATDFRRDLEDFIHGTARLPDKQYRAGDAIVREGEKGDCAYIVLDGHCQANRVVGGKTQMLRLLGPGEMFGETAVLTGSPRLATVTALVDTTVAVVDRSFFEEEMERTSVMALAIRAVASSFLDLNGQTAALLQEQTYFKAVELAYRELALSGRPGNEGDRWVPWKPLLSRLTEATGLPAETLLDRLSRQKGMKLEPAANRLVLLPIA
jgi:serine/threonine-protein kinase